MTAKSDIDRFKANLEDERNSALMYRTISQHERDPRLAEIYRKLAETEDKHADTWAQKIVDAGGKVPQFKPSLRTRILRWAVGRFGAQAVLPSLVTMENDGSQGYAQQPDAADMVGEEQSHARVLKQISLQRSGGATGEELAKMEGRHRAAGGNALRAAVLGASDGLLSNFNLVMGVAGAQLAGSTILLTGLAGLLAGAISMALGEYISVQSSRELYAKQISTEKEEIENAPEEEIEELVLIYQARGLDEEAARGLATKIMENPETAIETLARDELGIDPGELGGSAWEAAFTSFALFAVGAIIPVIPYIFINGTTAIILSAAASAVALFAVGAAITLFTGRSIWYSGFRQVLFGLAAAAATFVVGRLIGVTVAG